MFGVGLQIEEGGGDRSASRKSEKNDEESAPVREKETANEAAKHRIVGAWRRHIHSPRRMGAGSQRVARRSGRALPRRVTRVASASTTPRARSEGCGGEPKILMPTIRARK